MMGELLAVSSACEPESWTLRSRAAASEPTSRLPSNLVLTRRGSASGAM